MSGSCPVSAHVCRETARERDEARNEVDRLRVGINALATAGARGIDLMPTTCGTVTPQWVYDYLATLDGAWRDHVRALLNPTEGEEESESQPRPMPEFSPERARLLAKRPAHPWTPPDGVVGIF